MSRVKLFRRAIVSVALAAWAGLASLPTWSADVFPAKPLQLSLPYSAGSGPDVVARRLGDALLAGGGQPLIVINKPGANGWLAAGDVKRAQKDGYSLLMADTTMFALHPLIFKDMPFDFDRDFEPVVPLFSTHFFIVVAQDAPWKTVGEMLAAAKKMGGEMTAASFGTLGVTQAGVVALESASGTRMSLVPYKNQPDIYADVAAGRVAWAFGPAATIAPFLQSGRLRALAIAAPRRLASHSNVPTVAESGGPANFELRTAVALFAPRGTPAAALRSIHEAVSGGQADESLRVYMRDNGFERWMGTGADVTQAIQAERRHFAPVAAQMKPN